MEPLDSSRIDEIAFRAINQKGNGDEIDRYIYSQSGEGLALFLVGLAKKAIPIFGKAIKGAAKAAAPHVKEAFKAAGKSTINSAIDQTAKLLDKRPIQEVENLDHKPHKRRANGL